MSKFSTAPRSKDTLGISGMLGEDCSVFYEALFSPKHVGRVADLLVARLRATGVDETRFRVLLTVALYQAYKAQLEGLNEGGDSTATLAAPVIVEAGVDQEKIAIGVSYVLPEGQEAKVNEWQARLSSMENLTWFEISLGRLLVHADRLIVKSQATSRRVEVITLIGLQSKKKDFTANPTEDLEWVELGQVLEAPPKAGSLEELGDLNYATLLKEDGPGKKHAIASVEETLVVKGGGKEDDALLQSIRGRQKAASNDSTVVKDPGVEEDHSEVTIKGSQPLKDTHSTVVKGSEVEEDKSSQTIKGSETEKDDSAMTIKAGQSAEMSESQTNLYQEQMSQLQNRIKELETELNERKMIVQDPSAQPQAKSASLFGFMKRLFTGEEEKSEETTTEPTTVSEAPVAQAAPEIEMGLEEAAKSTGTEKIEDPSQVAKNLMMTIEAGSLDGTIKKIQKESAALQGEMKSQRGKKWVEGLVGDLIAEKAKIKDMTKKLTTSLRQKELEFKNKERALLDELKRRDEAMILKDKTAIRLKDQLSQTNMSLERLKSSSKSATQDGHYEKKYNYTRNLLAQVKEENAALKKRIDEAQFSQSSAQERSGPSESELLAQAEIERSKRQIEESRKQNAHLMEKILEAEKRHSSLASRAEEYRKRLDQAASILNSKKDELESLKKKMADLEAEKIRLARKLNEMKARTITGEPSSGGDSSEGNGKPPASDAA